MGKRTFFTSESVTEGHPDKMADQISDAILDEIIAQDPAARVAAETLLTTGLVLVSGEVTTNCYVDIPAVVRRTVKEIGYTRAKFGFDNETCAVLTSIDEQSADIALGVNRALEKKQGQGDNLDEIGAGDQGMVFGFACNENKEMMPTPISLAHQLSYRLAYLRKEDILTYLRPDGKSQVTVEYDGEQPVRVDKIVISTQHMEDINMGQMREDIIDLVIKNVVPEKMLDQNTSFYINPTGRFVIGGPKGDTGLTGRKIIVDTYGGFARHGGGAFSGKDPTKVDRSAAYAARYVAKNIVGAGLAEKCEVQIAYAIGVSRPVSVRVDTFGTAGIAQEKIEQLVTEVFDLRPAAIIRDLDLRRPIYRQLAAYGHFGRLDLDLPWERTDKVEIIKQLASKM